MTTRKDIDPVLETIRGIVGEKGLLTDDQDTAPYLVEWRDKFTGKTPAVIRPSSTEEVCAVLTVTYEAGHAIVPQGGNTGLVGGQIPSEMGSEFVLSLDRMTSVRSIDDVNDTIVVDGGALLKQVQEAADDIDRLFPLSLASEGSVRIGGALSTNAGGTNVLRYGNARDLVLGLEVVLPDGTLWENLSGLRKDNTGYDLKQLFVGAEGTLGVITGATLKLFAKPTDFATAFVGLPSPAHAVELLKRSKAAFDQKLTGFELIPRIGVEFVREAFPALEDPLDTVRPWYVLLELSSTDAPDFLWPKLESFLAPLMDEGVIDDAAIALNATQRQSLWDIRDHLSEAQKPQGGSIKHDVSLPISEIVSFLEEAAELVEAACPGIRPVPFGHLGDGNIHYNLSQPVEADRDAFLARWEDINVIVHDLVHSKGGSISAEHGLGQLKREEIKKYKSEIELNLMKQIKAVLDPKGLMNPGKVL